MPSAYPFGDWRSRNRFGLPQSQQIDVLGRHGRDLVAQYSQSGLTDAGAVIAAKTEEVFREDAVNLLLEVDEFRPDLRTHLPDVDRGQPHR